MDADPLDPSTAKPLIEVRREASCNFFNLGLSGIVALNPSPMPVILRLRLQTGRGSRGGTVRIVAPCIIDLAVSVPSGMGAPAPRGCET